MFLGWKTVGVFCHKKGGGVRRFDICHKKVFLFYWRLPSTMFLFPIWMNVKLNKYTCLCPSVCLQIWISSYLVISLYNSVQHFYNNFTIIYTPFSSIDHSLHPFKPLYKLFQSSFKLSSSQDLVVGLVQWLYQEEQFVGTWHMKSSLLILYCNIILRSELLKPHLIFCKSNYLYSGLTLPFNYTFGIHLEKQKVESGNLYRFITSIDFG